MPDYEKLEPVLRLVSLGYKAYPASRHDYGGKSPWCERGFYDATSDVARIFAWASEKHGCNWAVRPCEGMVILDADKKHGGLERLTALEAEHGPLPLTPCCQSGGGGKHFYFTCPSDFQAKDKIANCEGLELIAVKGGVIIPPSIHPESKRPYEWLVPPWDVPLASAPAWLLALVETRVSKTIDLTTLRCSSGSGPIFATLGPVPSGERNDVLPSVIGREFRQGFTEEEVLRNGLAWAAQNGYDADEMRRKVRSVARRDSAKASQQNPPPPRKVSVSVSEERSDSLSVDVRTEGSISDWACSDFLPSVLPSQAWPTLSEDAYYGLLGGIVKTVGLETEADPAGVLVSLLCGFGNAVGRGPFYFVNGSKHYANLYAVLVGLSSAGKGQAWDAAKYMLRFADDAWLNECVCLGLSSGEGLVKRIRDAETEQQPVKDEEGNPAGFKQVIVEAGAKDKRLLCLETEFQRLLAVSRREGNTLSAILRSLWDFGASEVLTKNPLRATDAHVSILAHVTKEELDDVLASRVEMVNGFANRFLWCHVQEMPDLADGGNFAVLDRFAEPLALALAKAKTIGEMRRSEEAAELWRERYGELRRAGNRVRACERARPQTLRLSMLYALADGSAEVNLAHLKAALAVWDYCEASARYLFQHDNKPLPPSVNEPEERLWEKLLEAIYRAQTGITKRELLRAVREPVEKVNAELTYLEKNRLAHRRTAKTGGRDAEVWFPGPDSEPPDDGGTKGRKEGSPEPDETEGHKDIRTEGLKDGRTEGTDAEDTSFLPSEAEPELEPKPQQSEATGQHGSEEGGFVVMPEQSQAHFTFEPSGGFRMASSEANKPSPLEPFQVLYHDKPEVRRAWFDADNPPVSEQERQQWLEAVRQDDFLARLDTEPEDEALDGTEFQIRLEAAEASLTAECIRPLATL